MAVPAEMKPTSALSGAARERRRILKFKTRYTQTIAVHPTLICFSSNVKEKSLDKLEKIMARISAVVLNHARTMAKLDQKTLAVRGHMGNNSDTQKRVAARYNIFDHSKKKVSQFRIPLEAWV